MAKCKLPRHVFIPPFIHFVTGDTLTTSIGHCPEEIEQRWRRKKGRRSIIPDWIPAAVVGGAHVDDVIG